MKAPKVKESTKWVINLVLYGLWIGVPLLGWLYQSEVLQNFGVVLMFLLGGLVSLVAGLTSLATVLVYFVKDRVDRLEFYEGVAKRNTLYHVCRILMLAVIAVYIWIGYPVFGFYLLLVFLYMLWLNRLIITQYEEFKETLKG